MDEFDVGDPLRDGVGIVGYEGVDGVVEEGDEVRVVGVGRTRDVFNADRHWWFFSAAGGGGGGEKVGKWKMKVGVYAYDSVNLAAVTTFVLGKKTIGILISYI